MTDSFNADLAADLRRDEGERLKPYRDTVGKLTIGVGRNLDDRGITAEESAYLLGNDIAETIAELDAACPWWRSQPEPVRRGMANMMFNLGRSRFLGFRNMLAALERGDYDRAAREALDSLWATQVGSRAGRIADLYRSAAAYRAEGK